MRKLIGTAVLALLALLLVALVYAASLVASYEQLDDPHHLAEKRKYLDSLPRTTAATVQPPNIVVILFDDLGYGDLGAYGSRAIATPHLDQLAAEGVRLTNFYAPAPYCTPSRAGLLTGRYPVHTGLTMINFPDASPFSWLAKLAGAHTRLPAEEITLAEMLRAAGYATGAFGKWHLGHHPPALPNDMGFDEFFGLLHSNDMSPLPLYRDREVTESEPIDQTTLTRRYTAEAAAFIDRHHQQAFFLYLPHTFPHVPLHVGEDRRGRSNAGLYGDVVEELDDSVGQIVAALRRHGLEHNTLAIITSDNGPWYQGSPGNVRGRKNDIFEGGMRVPFIAWWPGRIPARRVIDDMAMGIDVVPTVLDILDLPAPPDRIIDGESLWPLLQERGRKPHESLFFFKGAELMAVRSGDYKYHRRQYLFPGTQWEIPAMALIPRGPWLFDLSRDADESYDISAKEPGVVHRLRVTLEARQRALEENPRGWK